MVFRKEAVCQLINFHDWSLCCIQEVRPNQVRDLKAYTTFTCLSAEREGDGQGEGLAILYNEQKLRLLIQGIFGYLKHLSSQVSILKLAVQELLCGDYLRKRLKIRLLVINVHLDHISAHARLAGMTVILEELHDKIAQYPTLLMGDFNAESGKRFINLFKNFKIAKI